MTQTIDIDQERLMRVRPNYVIVLAALVCAAVALAGPPAASAATTCTFDDPSDTLSVQLTANADRAQLRVDGGGVIRVASDASTDVGCTGGSATTTTIDAINVFDNSGTGSTTVTLVEPASFSPGRTQEQGNNLFSEIEVNVLLGGGFNDRLAIIGSDVAGDDWRLGTGGMNFNTGSGDPAPDADTGLLTGIESHSLELRGGNDQVTAQGGVGTGSPSTAPRLSFAGGPGNDTIGGSNLDNSGLGDVIDGGADNDVMHGFGASDVFNGSAGINTHDGGADADVVSYQNQNPPGGVTVDLRDTGAQNTGVGTDTFAAVETVVGTPGPDRLIGDGAANVLRGLEGDDRVDGQGGADEVAGGPGSATDGNDTVVGGAGNDEIFGGGGVNTLTYADSPSGLTVNLSADPLFGTATGEGTDRIYGVQNLIGSPFADTLTGSAEANEITGGAGADTISALAGRDTVAIRDGEADTASCGADLDTAVADQASLDAVDPDCEATAFLPDPVQDGQDGGGDGPQTGDTEISFDLAAKAKQRVLERQAVSVRASCPQEDCTVVFGGKVRRLTETIAGGVTERVKLKLKPRQVRRLSAALDDGRKPKIAVTAQATDASGNAASDSLKLRAKG